MGLPNHEMCLRIWIAVVAFMALGNTFACFFGSPTFLTSNLYNGKPEQINGLTARLFGVWTLLACIVRAYCSMFITNRMLYHITMLTFVLALFHFVTELLAYKTCALGIGVIMPLIISSLSLFWMFIGLWYIEFDVVRSKSSTSKSRKPVRD